MTFPKATLFYGEIETKNESEREREREREREGGRENYTHKSRDYPVTTYWLLGVQFLSSFVEDGLEGLTEATPVSVDVE